MQPTMTGNGWDEWKNLVLAELKRLSTAVEEMNEINRIEHQEIRASIATHREETASDISALKIKAGIWGLIGAAIPAVGALIYWLLAL